MSQACLSWSRSPNASQQRLTSPIVAAVHDALAYQHRADPFSVRSILHVSRKTLIGTSVRAWAACGWCIEGVPQERHLSLPRISEAGDQSFFFERQPTSACVATGQQTTTRLVCVRCQATVCPLR